MRNHAVCLCIWLTYEMHIFMQQSCNVQLYIKRSLQDLVIDVQKSTVRDFVELLKIFFFFLIGNQRTIINEKKRKVQVVHDDEQQGTENTNIKTKERENQKDNLRENINSERDEESEKPQQRDHSKRLRWHKTFNSSTVFSKFSKERRFHSNQTIHIKHPGIKFQICELCFPSH